MSDIEVLTVPRSPLKQFDDNMMNTLLSSPRKEATDDEDMRWVVFFARNNIPSTMNWNVIPFLPWAAPFPSCLSGYAIFRYFIGNGAEFLFKYS